jgi:hypothetical protein
MAEEKRESIDSSAEQTAEFAKQIQQMMTNYFALFQNSAPASRVMNLNSRLLTYPTQRVNAASSFLSKLSQAADLQEVVKTHMEHAHMRMLMFHDLTKEIGDAVAASTNLLGAFASLLNWQKVLGDLARNSPTYRQTGGNERMRIWSAVPTQERQRTGDGGRKTTRR